MPELPEVETIKSAVQKKLQNAVFTDVIINNPKLRYPVPRDLAKKIKNRKIISFERIAKYILIHLDNESCLIFHLGMSGKIKLSETRGTPQKHDHLVFKTSQGYMIYNDPRRFGLCILLNEDKLKNHSLFKNLGIDPFDKHLNGTYLKEKLIKKSIAIKLVLLDQRIISGIGNIYASEALFLAGILPERPANSLSLEECHLLIDKVRQTLKQAILAGGSTLRDYRQPDGSLGYFQNKHCVYGKTGLPCPNCCCNIEETGGIQKTVLGGRSTYFCLTKQR